MMRGKTRTIRPSYSEKESAGIESGLSERKDFMAEYTYNDAAFNADAPASGQAGYYRGAKGRRGTETVSSKGYSFTMEGCEGSDVNSPIGDIQNP